MNILVLLPLAVLAIPIIPALIEIRKRKDKGPREIPEQTLYEDRSDISKLIPPLERARAKARMSIIGEMLRVVGDFSIPSGADVKEDIIVHGNLELGSKCHIHGSIKASGEVEVGQGSIVEGHILSEGGVIIRRNARVKGIVDSAEDIIIEENSVVGALSTGKSVTIAPWAKINRRISAGLSIITMPTPIAVMDAGMPSLLMREEAREVREFDRGSVPSFDLFLEEKDRANADERDRLFPILPESSKVADMEQGRPKDLSQSEFEVYKLAFSGCDVGEIGPELFMDPVQVQEAINSLIKRRYLDERLKPLTLEEEEKKAKETALETYELENGERDQRR